MRLIKIYSEDLQTEVLYKTDLITRTQENFTVMEVSGLDDAEKALGINFKELAYNLTTFKTFCEEHGLGLSVQTIGSVSDEEVEVLVEPEPIEDDEDDEEEGGEIEE